MQIVLVQESAPILILILKIPLFSNVEIQFAKFVKFFLSFSSQYHLHSASEHTLCAYEHDLCSQHPLIFVHSQNYKFELSNPCIVFEHLLAVHDNDTLLPKRYVHSIDLLNVNYVFVPCCKFTTFIETKVSAMKLQGFNLNI